MSPPIGRRLTALRRRRVEPPPPQLGDLVDDLACRLDPAVFAERRLGLELDPWQRTFLQSTHPRVIANASRQSGKSSMAAALGAHRAIYAPGSLVLLLSPTLRQSTLLFQKLLAAYRDAGRPVPAEAEGALSLRLAGGSRVVALPGASDNVRGYSSVSLLVVDEASRIDDELYFAVRPMMATSGGRIILLSTPNGQRGSFHQAWSEGGDDWQRYRVDATQCPRIAPAFLAEERRQLGPQRFASEYMCEFTVSEYSVFDPLDIAEAFARGGPEWDV